MPTVYGLFERLDVAEAGVRRLQEAGCSSDILGIAMRAPGPSREPDPSAAEDPPGAEPGVMALVQAGETVNVAGSNHYLVSGPLAPGLGTASMGGIYAALLSLGHSEDDAETLGQGLERGALLVAVFHLNRSQASTARRILDEEGARHVAVV